MHKIGQGSTQALVQTERPVDDRIDLHKFPAKMLARIADDVLRTYGQPRDVILDPFCGSGTVLVRARRLGFDSIGVDLNPLAAMISDAKVMDYNIKHLEQVSESLLKKIDGANRQVKVHRFKDIDYWFPYSVQSALSQILSEVNDVPQEDYRSFFLVTLSSIIRTVSRADPRISPPVFSKQMRESVGKRRLKVRRLFSARVRRNVKVISALQSSFVQCTSSFALVGDARVLPLPDSSVDLILTSPPYLDAQKYLRTFKLELDWLSLISEEELQMLKHRIIGTDLVSRLDCGPTNDKCLDNLLADIRRRDDSGDRAPIVRAYVLEMKKALQEICRVLKPGGVLALVLGDNNVSGRPVAFHKIVEREAGRLGLNLLECKEDRIRYRSFMLKRNVTAGLIESEWILVFRKETTVQKPSLDNNSLSLTESPFAPGRQQIRPGALDHQLHPMN